MMIKKKRSMRGRAFAFIRKAHDVLTAPLALVFLTYSNKVDPAYNMSWPRRVGLGIRFWINTGRVRTGTGWRAHIVMAMKLLETPASQQGDVLECGCWKGGTTVNLSLICKIVGRQLKVYDSFEGLPAPEKGDPIAEDAFRGGFVPGIFGGALEEVQDNVRRHGAIEVCSFHKGWFCDTLPHHEGNIVFAYWDVDFYSSLHDCLINLWPHVVDEGYIFLDEYRLVNYCSVFYSEKYWQKYFNEAPPGLVGVGTGVQVGMFYVDPSVGIGNTGPQFAASTAYCQKGSRALWEYYPDEIEAEADTENAAAVAESATTAAQ